MSLSDEGRSRLIRAVQNAVPLVEEPFARLAADLGLDGGKVLDLLATWSEEGKLREISAILEGSALGYESALVAGVVAEADLPRVVEVVNSHPTVTHNYLRNHAYNLWYTIAVPLETGLDATISVLSRLARVRFHALRRTATFKIGVNFDLSRLENRTEATPVADVSPIEPTDRDKLRFRTLQTPLSIEPRPFDRLAAKADLDTRELLAFGRAHLGGAIRRYVGTLRHRQLGVRANAMIVWNVPDGKEAELGARLARAPGVSHCYARNPIEGFPYTLYSMMHGPDLETCERAAAGLAGEIGVDDYALLVSLEEYKKTRLRYFLPELDAWWARYG